jgi:hypothetical protein
MTVTVFKDSTEGICIDLKNIEKSNDARVLKILVDVVLPQCVFDVVGLLVVLPVLAQLVDLARNVSLFFHVKSLLRKKINNYSQ